MKPEEFDSLIDGAIEWHAAERKRAAAAMRKLVEDDRRRKGDCTKCGAKMHMQKYRASAWLRCPRGCTARCVPLTDVAT